MEWFDKLKSKYLDKKNCPAYWTQRNYDDCDEGCHLYWYFDCWKCKYWFFPNFVIKIIVKIHFWKAERYWRKHGGDDYDDC